MFYAIEKKDSEWIIFVHGVAILRCARSDVALEIVKTARALLGDTAPDRVIDYALPGETLRRARSGESGA